MFDLTSFRLQDMTACGAALRQLGIGAASIEEAADRITRYLYTNLTTQPDEDPACVLVRLFKTHPYGRLSPELRSLADTRLGEQAASPGMKCLTLLGSAGAVAGWNDPAQSSRFRVLPLASEEALMKLPMFAQLFAQFEIDLPFLNQANSTLLLDQQETTFNAFYLPQALNSPYVPGQSDFVIPFGVQSVLGFGGLLPTGELFAVILFANVVVPRETADLFKAFALATKLSLTPFEHEHLTLPTPPMAPRAGQAEGTDPLARLRDRGSTLEALLAVQEQAVGVQSSLLASNLSNLRRQTNELHAQSRRFESLSAASPIGIFETDEEGRCLYTNASWQQIAGLSLEECLADGWRRAIASDDRERVFQTWSQATQQGQDCAIEFRMQRPDGAIRWVRVQSHPLRDAVGQVVGHVGTTEDITERKRAEEALRESERRLQEAQAMAHLGNWELDLVRNRLLWSDEIFRIFEIDKAQFTASYETFLNAVHPDDRVPVNEAYTRSVQNRTPYEIVHRLQMPDGRIKYVQERCETYYDAEGRPNRSVGTVQDITERREDKLQLQRSQALLNSVFEHLPNMVFVKDAQTLRFVEFNKAGEKLTGFSREDLLGKSDYDFFPKEEADFFTEKDRTVLTTGSLLEIPEEEIKTKHQGIRILQTKKVPLCDAQGVPQYLLGISEDITERKAAEAQFKQVFESTYTGMLMVAEDGRMTLVNPQIEQVFGYRRDELIGQSVEMLLPERYRASHHSQRRSFVASGTSRPMAKGRELYGRHRDGTEFPVEIGLTPVETPQGRQILASIADITERKQAENTLRQVSALQEAILTQAAHAVIATNTEGIIQLFNPAAENLLGYRADEMIGKLTPAVFHDPEEVAARAKEFGSELGISLAPGFDVFVIKARHNLPNQHEWTYIRKDGRRVPVHLSVTALRNADGGINGFLGLALDITDRRNAEVALRENIERTRLILDRALDAVISVDEKGAISGWNAQAETIFGWSTVEVLGQDLAEMIIPPQYRDAHRQGMARYLATGEGPALNQRIEISALRRNGKEFPVELAILPIHMGSQTFFSAFLRDITSRRRAEQARLTLQQAINHAQDGMALLDADGCYTYMNPAHAAIFGYAVDELLGKSWKDLYHPEWAAMIEHMYFPILQQEGHWQGELVGKKKNGEGFHIELSLTLLEATDARARALLCTCRDISRRKQMEQELIAAKEAAEAGARVKAEFLATMSHEIRTPMNGVIGMTGLLLDTTLTSEQQEYVETLRASGESLLTIINDILDFSKIEAGKLDLEPILFDLRTTLDQVLELLAPSAHRKRLELSGLVNADVPSMVIGDPGRFKQILINLVGNGIKFTERGEVNVRVSLKSVTDDKVILHVDVADTGIGISTDGVNRLFASFSQADASTTRKYGGTGLGLAICKRLVELMSGAIGVDSAPGHGSRFWFDIRLGRTTAASPAVSPLTELRGKRLGIVDAQETNHRILGHYAAKWEMEVQSIVNATEVLAQLRSAAAAGRPVDLAILDMQMPELNGLNLARRIKADPTLRNTHLILLTSIGQRGDAKAAQEAGVEAYLTKPIREHQLAECFRLVLGRRQTPLEPHPLITRHTLSESHAQTRHHLLVVDDNPVNQKVAVKMLEKLGYRVDVAGNGKEALAALARRPYALIFMDCQMPDMDGFQATAFIRRHARAGHRPSIIAMTANVMERDREQCLAAGMDDFICKPVKREDLQRVLARWLEPPRSQEQAA